MAYRASIGGAFGGGAGAPQSHPIDIGGAIDALTGGASTLIQNAYMRKQGQAKLALEQQQRDTEASRYSEQNRINAERFQQQDARETQRYGAEQKQKKYDAGLKALGEGVRLPDGYWDEFTPSQVPGAPSAPPAPTASPVAPAPAIAQAYQAGGNEDMGGMAGAPMPQAPAQSIAAPVSAPAPVATPPRLNVPTYDTASDPRIKKAVALEQAKADLKLRMAPQMASADSAKTVNTARGMIPVAAARAAAEQAATAPGKTAQELAVAAAKQKLMLDAPPQVRAETNSFNKQNKSLVDAVQPYALAKNALEEAKAGNPAALKSAIIAYAGVADPKAQLRQGIIQMVSQVDPSIKGRFDMAVDKLASGTLPPRIIADMEKLIERTHTTHKALYDQRRAAEVVRHPTLDGYIPRSDELFNVPGISSNATGGGTTTPNQPAANPFMSLPKATP